MILLTVPNYFFLTYSLVQVSKQRTQSELQISDKKW